MAGHRANAPVARSRTLQRYSPCMTRRSQLAVGLAAAILAGCGVNHSEGPPPPDSARAAAFLDTLEERTFHYFWDLTNTQNGLTPDRAPSPSFSSIAAVGFALTAYPIGVERNYITRAQAAQRTLATLRFFWTAPQDSAVSGSTGYHGFFYHFLDMSTGQRFQNVELSTIDTSLLLGGILLCQSFFDGTDPVETEIRGLADSIYFRVDWNWAQARPPAVSMGWHPEGGFIPTDWIGYNEAMILYVLALGSPTNDDGTLAPTAAGGAVAFTPEIAIPALLAMRETYGSHLFSTYGFRDAFNPTFTATGVPVERGTVDPTLGWFDVDYLGIDQGPILAMIENYRTGLIWRLMRGNPHIVRGLCRAGFTGGWLAGKCPAR